MSNTTSEQLLKALEHSKEDPVVLLDEAALIARVEYDVQARRYRRVTGSEPESSNSFREQWLLRWIIKRLNEAVFGSRNSQHANVSASVVANDRVWCFLAYLLSVIAEQKSTDILLERNFTKLLTSASVILLENYKAVDIAQHVRPVSGSQSERPRKRLKLSSGLENDTVDRVEVATSGTTALFQFFIVVDAWGRLLQPRPALSETSARSVTPAWAESVREAGQFVGQVVASMRPILDAQTETAAKEFITSVSIVWLRLWHNLASSNNMTERKTINKAFNETCLNSCLEAYSSLEDSKGANQVSSRKEIERQIALYTVLPLRSAFNTKFAGPWEKIQGSVTWSDLEPIFKMFQDQLGSALQIVNAGSHEIVSLLNPIWASYLVKFSSRVVPKDDIRKKQRERPWLEALALCLAQLAFFKHMPRMIKAPDGPLLPEKDLLPPSLEFPTVWPDSLLDTIVTGEIHFSISKKEYLVVSILSWRHRPLPLSTLAMIVKLDPSIFVPATEVPNATACLNGLLLALAEQGNLNSIEHEQFIVEIANPLLEAFAKARDFDGLLKMWLPNLEEALRRRTSITFSVDHVPSALVWDDEDICLKFTDLCRQHGTSGNGRDLISEVITELKGIPERIGPTVDISAKLIVLESIICAAGKDITSMGASLEDLTDLADLLAAAVQQPNDYQGQRWRFWSLITLLCTIDSRFNRFDLVAVTISTTCKDFHSTRNSKLEKFQHNQRTFFLMEYYQIFCFIVQNCLYTAAGRNFEENLPRKLLGKEIKHLANMLEMPKIVAVQQRTTDGELWNGRLNSLQDMKQLSEGLLARLMREAYVMDGDDLDVLDILSPLKTRLQHAIAKPALSTTKLSFVELVELYLTELYGKSEISNNRLKSSNGSIASNEEDMRDTSDSSTQIFSQSDMNKLASDAQKTFSRTEDFSKLEMFRQLSNAPSNWTSALIEAVLMQRIGEVDLKTNPVMARLFASKTALESTMSPFTLSDVVLQLELCMLTLKTQPGVVNQASIDSLLKDLTTCTSSAIRFDTADHFKNNNGFNYNPSIIFDRLTEIIGLLLARYRRRLAGRNHLLLPVLQNLLKCLFYTPSRTYLYQNAATSRQKQALRSSFPGWLKEEALPAASATKFSKILSSICNPSTASARSAHRTRRKSGPSSVQLNDETVKARRLAAQYMQYLLMEYSRCTLDGIIQPDAREKLLPGLYSILDAMDRDLMKAMNSAMDPSSRAIFKGLYDDWVKHWKWDQT